MSIIKALWREKAKIDGFNFEQFLEYVYHNLLSSGEFEKVTLVNEISDIGIDIIAETKSELLFIEVKKLNIIGVDYIVKLNCLRNVEKYKNPKQKSIKIILLNGGDFTNDAKKTANELEIILWDYKTLFEIKELKNKLDEVYKIEYEATQEDTLIKRLESISKGQSEWNTYQKCIADIFELLFYPTLGTPRYEITDYDGANRRDIIMENQSESGFWRNIREIYKGDYVVVDAKNYTEPIGKKPIIEIAHYLKPYGCGMFGIITCRHGIADSAFYAMKEQWIGNNKLIITLNDSEIIEMLKLKKDNGVPEEIIRMKIAEFRMKL